MRHFRTPGVYQGLVTDLQSRVIWHLCKGVKKEVFDDDDAERNTQLIYYHVAQFQVTSFGALWSALSQPPE